MTDKDKIGLYFAFVVHWVELFGETPPMDDSEIEQALESFQSKIYSPQ